MRRMFTFFLTMLLLVCICSCELSYQAPAVGRMRILVLGNDYSYGNLIYYLNGEQFRINGTPATAGRLYNTVNDATQVREALSKLAEKAGMDHQSVCLTSIDDVSETRLVAELNTLAASSSEHDITIIYYSGHGFGVKAKLPYGYDTSTCSYIVPRFSERPDASVLFPVSDFLDLVNEIQGVKVVLGDFCYSGSLVQSNNFSVTSGEYSLLDPATLFFRYRDDICENSSLFCLSASRYMERSYEYTLPSDPRHGKFTYALLNALGWDEESQELAASPVEKGGRITFSELARYVTRFDGDSKQTPMLSGGSNDIILFSF